MSTTAIYITKNNLIGFRPNKFNWTNGENILTQDGKSCKVIKVVETNDDNIAKLNQLIEDLQNVFNDTKTFQTIEICIGLNIRTTTRGRRWANDEERVNYALSIIEKI